MHDFKEFMLDGMFPDIVIQMALREIDAVPLAKALVGQDEIVREIIFRNMSKRAVVMLKEDIRDLAESSPEAIRAGQTLFAELLTKNAKAYAELGIEAARKDAAIPPIDLGNRDAIISTFCLLADFVRAEGLLPFEAVTEKIPHPLMRKGLIMLLEGWDPLLVRSVLEKYKTSYLRAQEIEYDLVIEGIDSLANKDHSLFTEQKLRALVAGL